VYLSGLPRGPLYLAAGMEYLARSPTLEMVSFRKETPRSIAYDLKRGKTTPNRYRCVPVEIMPRLYTFSAQLREFQSALEGRVVVISKIRKRHVVTVK
jgi:hypothetical protein